MGDEMRATKELEGLKEELESLAEHFEINGEQLDGTVDSDMVVFILKGLANGRTAENIIERYGLDVEP